MRIINRIRLVLIPVLFIGTLPAAMAENTKGWNYRDHTRIAWREYGTGAFNEARRTGRPLFVLIYSDLCGWCRKYEVETLEQPGTRHLLENQFIPVAVDNDRQQALGRQLGIKFVPTTLVLAPNGEKILRFHGVQSAADLTDTLTRTLTLWRKGGLAQPDFGSAETCCPVIDSNVAPSRSNGRE